MHHSLEYTSELVTILLCDRDAPETEIMCTILGLNLLYLLVENRLADFHCEVRGYAVNYIIS
jgi:hypothetical protein